MRLTQERIERVLGAEHLAGLLFLMIYVRYEILNGGHGGIGTRGLLPRQPYICRGVRGGADAGETDASRLRVLVQHSSRSCYLTRALRKQSLGSSMDATLPWRATRALASYHPSYSAASGSSANVDRPLLPLLSLSLPPRQYVYPQASCLAHRLPHARFRSRRSTGRPKAVRLPHYVRRPPI